MKKIYKYGLSLKSTQDVSMPAGATILCVQLQYDRSCLWCLVDPSAKWVNRRIAIHGTGEPIEGDPGEYVGTYQQAGGDLVWHVFDQGETK